jgi:hypothetical protein
VAATRWAGRCTMPSTRCGWLATVTGRPAAADCLPVFTWRPLSALQ